MCGVLLYISTIYRPILAIRMAKRLGFSLQIEENTPFVKIIMTRESP
jgi:hypothetical protein